MSSSEQLVHSMFFCLPVATQAEILRQVDVCKLQTQLLELGTYQSQSQVWQLYSQSVQRAYQFQVQYMSLQQLEYQSALMQLQANSHALVYDRSCLKSSYVGNVTNPPAAGDVWSVSNAGSA
mmetsp:Transcript_3882/g.9137  ORF Transcript_3882/g.9137 Transcript_3882/m.9137 type:complete len:122 (-) Transcript_3882:144-509(-)